MRTLILTIILAMSALAQTPASPTPRPACDGNLATIRISAVTPTGSMEGLLKAVAAHKDWYKSHGLADMIFAAPIVLRDPATRAQVYSTKELMTYHVYPATPGPEVKHDDAYEAFVKLYRENSEIKQTYNVCMPKH